MIDDAKKSRYAVVRHASIYLLSGGATGIIGLLVLVAFTRLLPPAEYGRYSVLIAVAAMIAAIAFEWIPQGLVRFKGTNPTPADAPLLGTLGLLFTLLCITVFVIGGLLSITSGQLVAHSSVVEVLLLCCLICAQAGFRLVTDALRVDLRAPRYGFVAAARAALTLVLGVVAAFATRNAVAVILAVTISYVCASFISVPHWLGGVFNFRAATRAQAHRIASYGLPLAATMGMVFVLDSADRLMLAAMKGYVEAGVYAAAYMLAQSSIGAVLGALNLGAVPLAVRAFHDGGAVAAQEVLNRNFSLALALGLPAVVGLAVIAPVLDRLLLGNYVAGLSASVTSIVAVGAGLAGIRAFCFDIVFMLERKTLLQGAIVGAAAALNVLLNLLLIPRWGAIGAAWATLVSFAAALVGSWLFGRAYIKVAVSWRYLAKVSAGAVLLAAVVSGALTLGSGPLTLALAIVCGASVYALTLLATNAAGVRGRVLARLGK